ncbi:MAG: hypothetical protein HY516_04850 [Candidatus Aenigmarchaeota archaeon]|nr:hypothetical protein [Candidatus Aenigmarchaeota archaeon]
MEEPGKELSIYERVGFFNAFGITLSATPWRAKASTPFYGFWVYRDMMKRSRDLEGLLRQHEARYGNSAMFRLFRPSYGAARRILRERYEIK